MQRVLAAGGIRQWKRKLREVNLPERQFGVGVSGGMEHVELL